MFEVVYLDRDIVVPQVVFLLPYQVQYFDFVDVKYQI
jgi:hypothetical protein